MRARLRNVLAMLGACSMLAATCGVADSGDSVFDDRACAVVIDDAGDVIQAAPDGASLCPSGACNYQLQAGCTPDQTCQPNYTRDGKGVEPQCLPAGDRLSGEACDGDSPCARGLVCAGGACRKLCCGRDWSACDEGESCFRQLQFVIDDTPVDTGAWLCFPVHTCDVLDSLDCPLGRDCKVVDPTGNEACVPHSAGLLGEPCGGSELCDRGLSCVGGACVRLCAAEICGEPACPSQEGSCVHFNRNPPGVGECSPGW